VTWFILLISCLQVAFGFGRASVVSPVSCLPHGRPTFPTNSPTFGMPGRNRFTSYFKIGGKVLQRIHAFRGRRQVEGVLFARENDRAVEPVAADVSGAFR
jgi:hypothetical protein